MASARWTSRNLQPPGGRNQVNLLYAHTRTTLLYTAYFDESDTHGPAPNLVLSALLGHVRQWDIFGRRIRDIQRRHGFRVFHAKDLRRYGGEFKGWTEVKGRALVAEIADAIRDNLNEAVSASLPAKLYREEYRGRPSPPRMRLDSQYGVCFRVILANLVEIIRKDGKRHRLNVVLEDGHANVRDAVRIFQEWRDVEVRSGNWGFLGKIEVEKKNARMELMVADFVAHAIYLSEARLRAGGRGYFEMAEGTMPKRREAGTRQLEISIDTFSKLKDIWVAQRQLRMDQSRAKRDAFRGSTNVPRV